MAILHDTKHCRKLAAVLLCSLSLISSSSLVSLAAPSSATKKSLAGRVNKDVIEADQLMVKGKYGEAEELYHRALNDNSKDISARVGYGMALTKEFKLDRGLEEFNKALQDDPHNAMAHCGKAIATLYKLQSSSMSTQRNRASMLKEAGEECNKALDIDTAIPEIHYALGLVFTEEGRMDKAQSAFEGALKLDPKFSDALAHLGLLKLQQSSNAEAIDNFKQAIASNSGNSTAHYGLGQAYLKDGQIDQAISELNTALYQNSNSAPVHLALGKAYETQGNTVAAVKEYQESIRIKPENSAAYLALCNIRESRGDIELAIAELKSGLELNPNSVDLHMRLASDTLKLEKLDDAIKEYEAVLAMSPGRAGAVDGLTRAYYLKAQKETTGGFISTNEFGQAQAMIANAIRLNPNSLQLRLAQAKLRAIAGDPVNLKMINPTNDGERIELAEALLAENKFQEASTQMNQVINNVTTARDAYAVGDLALMIKDLNSAEASYNKARSMPDNADPARAERGLAQVAKARDSARQDLTMAEDLEKRKQLASAVDKYHSAIFQNPRMPDARIGLADTLNKLYPNTPKYLRDSTVQIKAYMALSPNLPPKEVEKLQKRIGKLEQKAYKMDQKPIARRSSGSDSSAISLR